MQEWNATTMRMAKPRRLLRARLDLVMLRTAIAFPHTGKVDPRYRAPSRASQRPPAFSDRRHYALIRHPYNERRRAPAGYFPRQQNQADRGIHSSSLPVEARMGPHSSNK